MSCYSHCCKIKDVPLRCDLGFVVVEKFAKENHEVNRTLVLAGLNKADFLRENQ